MVRRDVERRLIPGAVVVVARGGRGGFSRAFGFQDREAGSPMALGRDLPHRLDDQADDLGRGDDAGQKEALKSPRRSRVPAGIRRDDGRG